MAVVKACRCCGEPFVAVNEKAEYCSRKCRDSERHPGATTARDKATVERKAKAESRRAFLARRDAEYAANAAPVTVEERQFRDSELGMVMRRVETRGFCPCASRAGIRRQLVTDKGVVYFA